MGVMLGRQIKDPSDLTPGKKVTGQKGEIIFTVESNSLSGAGQGPDGVDVEIGVAFLTDAAGCVYHLFYAEGDGPGSGVWPTLADKQLYEIA